MCLKPMTASKIHRNVVRDVVYSPHTVVEVESEGSEIEASGSGVVLSIWFGDTRDVVGESGSANSRLADSVDWAVMLASAS